jgi:hypothetical protein
MQLVPLRCGGDNSSLATRMSETMFSGAGQRGDDSDHRVTKRHHGGAGNSNRIKEAADSDDEKYASR